MAPARHEAKIPAQAAYRFNMAYRINKQGFLVKELEINWQAKNGGETGIRTQGTVASTHAFQACSLNHSDISP